MPVKPTQDLRRSADRVVQSMSTVARVVRHRRQSYLQRRPHRSFRRTYRRDCARSLQLPGYWRFTVDVLKTLRRHQKIFIYVTLIYAGITAAMVGFASQESYNQLSNTITDSGSEIFTGNWGEVGKASVLFITAISGGVNTEPSEAQQIYSILLILLAWLSTVWLLRNCLAGRAVRVRDGLYNSGAPILPTLLIGLVFIIQMLPLALAMIGYSAASASGLLAGGAEAMLFWVVAALLATLSLYWGTSTFIALIVVTLPGMYPVQALKTAGDLVIGRRMRILLRFAWLAVITFSAIAVVMLPVILLDGWLKSLIPALSWLPLVPLVLLLAGSATVIWVASYTYLLYRKVVEDDAKPA